MSNQDRNRGKRISNRISRQVIEAKRQALIQVLAKGNPDLAEKLQAMTYPEIVAAKNAGNL